MLSASGDLNVFLVSAAGAAGAFLGDSICYWVGRNLGTRAAEKFLRGDRGKRTLEGGRWLLQRRARQRAA